jgi:SAM-dependent methyltransferase
MTFVKKAMRFMTEHAERFTGRVTEYERYRLRYPMEVLDVLRGQCGLTAEKMVADVGAGTGMLAELFLENGNHVIAVEPNAEMRTACEKLLELYAGLTVVAATAESTTLNDASVDFVAVGRALHWFDMERATQEFRRILRPDGWVVLVANGRSQGESKKEKDLERILIDDGVDYKDVKRRHRVHDAVTPMFREDSLVHEEMHGEQSLTLEEFLGQVQSYSAAPLPGHAKYEGMQTALRRYFDQWQEGGVLRMGTTCYLNCGQFNIR